MNYPLISEYIEAIKSAEDNFEQLSSLRPVLDSYGNPIMSSGNFAVVFKMKDINTGKLHAVKCFIKDQEGRNESYAMIADELKNVNSPYILPIRFLKKELFVDTSQSNETEFPVLVMDWVEGKTLDAYLRENLDNQYRLQVLSYRFCQMSAWLMSQPFAHGDLKPDNILVQEDGSLVLVDYDGFYVPAMKGQEARELGSPDFRHPQRTPQDFDEHIDGFSIATIALSLKAISIDAQLYHAYAASDRLLLSANDYHDIGSSKTMQKIIQLASDTELSALLSTFYMASALKVLDKSHIKVFEIEMPAIILGEGKTVLTQEDVKQATEKYGELVHVVLAYSVIEIGIWAFRGCTGLTSVTIPNSVTEIGDSAFRDCSGLTSVTIPNSVTSIGAWAFRGCTGLTSITIPNSVTKIGNEAFSDCSGLTSIIVKNGNSKYDSRNNCNAIIETSTNRLIAGCKNTIIPNSVTWIGDDAFRGCTGLTSVTITNAVTEIGDGAFSNCRDLTSIIVENGNSKYDSRDNCNAIIETSVNILIAGCKNTIIPNSVTKIGESAFRGCTSLTSVTIPNSVTEIGESAFFWCSNLISITIPDSVTKIGVIAFHGCSNLTSITIPKGTRPKFKKLLYQSLHSKLVEKTVIEKPISVIANRKDTKTLVKEVLVTDGVLKKKDVQRTHEKLGVLDSVVIPNSVSKIWDYAFAGCFELKKIVLSQSIRSIGRSAFEKCTNLSIIENLNSQVTIGRFAFRNCTSLKKLTLSCSVVGDDAFSNCINLENIEIGETVSRIGYNAFGQCGKLTKIRLPQSLTDISGSAFDGCSRLVDINIDAKNKYYTSKNGVLYTKNKSKLVTFPRGIKGEFEVPDFVKKIGENAFSGSEKLTKVILPEHVTTIGHGAFSNCKKLKSIKLPSSLKIIEAYTFFSCENLTSVIIPDSVKEIEMGAFCNCTSLTKIRLSKYIKNIYVDDFEGCVNLCKIEIPKGSRQRFEEMLDEEWHSKLVEK